MTRIDNGNGNNQQIIYVVKAADAFDLLTSTAVYTTLQLADEAVEKIKEGQQSHTNPSTWHWNYTTSADGNVVVIRGSGKALISGTITYRIEVHKCIVNP